MSAQATPKLAESLKNSKCEYRTLGKSGLSISVPIFGCMSFGDPKSVSWAIGEEEVSHTSSGPFVWVCLLGLAYAGLWPK